MSYTLEELQDMPIHLLQGIDITSKEEEDLVQGVLNEKRSNQPVVVDFIIPSYMTDNMDGEKEAKLQAEIDAKKEEAKKRLLPDTVLIVPEEEIQKVSEVVKAPFCQFCDSKGVRHKKNCTRLSNNKI